jgi:pyruvate formate-lyase activating enzyme-like uncharacterized protein
MGDELRATRELEGIKEEMRALAEVLDSMDVDLDSQVVADLLEDLADGKTSAYIVQRYGIHEESGV